MIKPFSIDFIFPHVLVELIKSSCFTVFIILLTIPLTVQKLNGVIYILQWTYTPKEPWVYRWLETGQEAFVMRNCSFQNCFITPNRLYFGSVLDFDVLLFNVVHIRVGDYNYDLPLNRSEFQLYVLFGAEPAWYNPIPNAFNNFFNLTWTYKLKSDIVNPYFVVKNRFGNIIGPKTNMHWIDISDMAPLDSNIVQKLQNKRIAAAWVVSHCRSHSRNVFYLYLKKELSKYKQKIHIYGECGDLSCPKIVTDRNGVLTNCYSNIEKDYYFYLAFENSITEDYVTEKVLHGLQHFSVPIVFGGANYTRFLPDGIYLDAIKLGVERLAREMNDIIKDPPRYYDFFKWHGYYSFHDTADDNYTGSICAFCAYLNRKLYKKTVYTDIKQWWKTDSEDDTVPKDSLPKPKTEW